MTAGDLLAFANEKMSVDEIAAHAIKLATLVGEQHRLLTNMSIVIGHLNTAVAADDAAFGHFHDALAGAMKLLDSGQTAGARVVLAKLVDAQVPVRPRVDAVTVAPLPTWIFSPGEPG